MKHKLQEYCLDISNYKRLPTREVGVGDVSIGAENPIKVQSMTTTDTMDTQGTIAQSIKMIDEGCELVRITAPSIKEAKNLKNIRNGLRKKGYKIINPQLYSIDEQIDIFSNAEKIIAPHGSNLANIIFCKPGTEIIEIAPFFRENEKIFDNRYANLCNINNLKHNRILSDSIDVENHSILAKKYIHPNALSQSNYYKNLIVKTQDINQLA